MHKMHNAFLAQCTFPICQSAKNAKCKRCKNKNLNMAEYRFHLQKYKMGSKITCPSCGRNRCFTKYVDEADEVVFPDSVGKCDHENSCGYHYTPKDYFHDNGTESISSVEWKPQRYAPVAKPSEPSFIDPAIMKRSLVHYDINPLFCYLSKIFGDEETHRLFHEYRVGTSAKWGGSTVYWQIDQYNKVRTGKVMLYDKANGHRVKEPNAYVSWAHSELKLANYNLRQCFFGEHLLPINPKATVVIVESEKTALICSHFLKDYVWIATGGKNACLNSDAVKVLSGRDVMLIPDLGATEKWNEKIAILKPICKSVVVSDVLEEQATEEQRKLGLDIADFLLMEDTPQLILQKMIARNPCLQKLIDTFDLEIVEE